MKLSESFYFTEEGTSSDGKYITDTAFIHVSPVEPPQLSIEEPINLNLVDGQDKVFTCRISGGQPDPVVLKWFLDDQILQEGQIGIDEHAPHELKVKITPDWNGKWLKCVTTQMDSMVWTKSSLLFSSPLPFYSVI